MSCIDLSRKAGESEIAYIRRLGEAKDTGLIDMTWQELASVFNKNLRDPGVEWGESAYRKKYAGLKQFSEEYGFNCGEAETSQELIKLRQELEKEKVKIRDERNEYRRLIREEARKESYKEQFIRSIIEAGNKTSLDYSGEKKFNGELKDGSSMLIPLCDLHTGIQIENWWNEYDEYELKYRLNHYLDRIFEIQMRHGCKDAYICISEVLSGIIHNSLRIESNQDLIDQFLIATDYICSFISELSERFNAVHVYVAPGNHSRINAKKEDDLAHENMDNLIIPFISAKMQNYPNVYCHDNDRDQGVALFSVEGFDVLFVHGDKDSPNTVANKMSAMFGKQDIILMAHRHYNTYLTDGDVKVIQTGSMCGPDEYAVNKRLVGNPEQTVCIITEPYGLDCIYDVKLSLQHCVLPT